MSGKRRIIGVIGSGDEDDKLNSMAAEVGRLIAQSGHILVNGGHGGVMRASAMGCREAGGVTLGLLPGLDPQDANQFIEIPVVTGLGEMRNFLIVKCASALIAIGGGYGTLSEIALALKLKKTVVGLDTWDVSKEIVKAADPKDAVEKAIGTT